MAARTKVFQNGNSQALTIPAELSTDNKDYYIQKIGNYYIPYPTDDPWSPTREFVGKFSANFLENRNQPLWEEVSKREDF